MHDSLTSDFDSGQLVETLADLAEAASAVILPYWRAGAEVITKADDTARELKRSCFSTEERWAAPGGSRGAGGRARVRAAGA